VYKKYQNGTVWLPGVIVDEYGHTGTITWSEASVCATQTSKCVTLYLDNSGFNGFVEENDKKEIVMRLTPDHIVPVLKKNSDLPDKSKDKVKKEHAYLLEKNMEVLWENNRVYGQYETPLFLEDGSVAVEDLLENNSIHKLGTKRLTKVFVSDTNNGSWEFYGFKFVNECENDCEENRETAANDSTGTIKPEYYMLMNGMISHESNVKY
jgi:hypothetical protein